MQVAWIGLGAMGRPMAGRLGAAFDTRVWNRRTAVADAHAKQYGTTACTLEQTTDADVLFTCLPTSAEVVGIADRLADELRPDTVWVDCTSGEPAASRELAARLAERGVAFLDAPVSGGTDGAAAGTLTFMVGGDDRALARVTPAIEVMAGRIVHVGGVGTGHAVKAVNNILLAANLWAAGEGLAALAGLGVDLTAALEVINASSGRSFASERPVPERIMTREFPVTFSLGLLTKDTGIGVGVTAEAGAPAPLLGLVHQLYRTATAELGADVDHSAAVQVVERWAGHEIA